MIRWKTVASREVKWDEILFSDFKEWIKENVPQGTSDQDIKISFEVTEKWGYYDDVSTEVEMSLAVAEEE